jgi:acetolactate synthase-1/2/3 large subunit
VRAQLPRDAIITTDVGWNKNGVGQQFPIYTPGSVLTPGRLRDDGLRSAGGDSARRSHVPTAPSFRWSATADSDRTRRRSRLQSSRSSAIVWLVMNNNAYGTIAGLQKAAYGLTHGTLFPVAEGAGASRSRTTPRSRVPTVARRAL